MNNVKIEGRKKALTRDEWFALGKKLYGDNVEDWRVRCPMCSHIATVKDFKEAGADGPDSAFVECLGRYTGKSSPVKGDSSGCNWAAYGLFGIPNDKAYIVMFPDGDKSEVFPFADDPEVQP